MSPTGGSTVCRNEYVVCHNIMFERRKTSFKPPRSLLQTFPCKELTLPSTESTHSADLVVVVDRTGEHHHNVGAFCVAVSPEGVVRYWANIAHDATYVEVDADVNEECVALIAMVRAHQVTMERVCIIQITPPP